MSGQGSSRFGDKPLRIQGHDRHRDRGTYQGYHLMSEKDWVGRASQLMSTCKTSVACSARKVNSKQRDHKPRHATEGTSVPNTSHGHATGATKNLREGEFEGVALPAGKSGKEGVHQKGSQACLAERESNTQGARGMHTTNRTKTNTQDSIASGRASFKSWKLLVDRRE